MRRILLAVVAIQLGLTVAARAENPPAAGRPISEALPLYDANHCNAYRDSAEQLFCGDPELNAAAAKLNVAIQDRLSRLANRRLAIAENAEWIKDRNSSCGIFDKASVSADGIRSIKPCLLTETEERIEILTDPNFDCLATNTTAGMLICSDPTLAIAKAELNDHVLGLVARLNGDQARDALGEYERWSRERDRKCRLADKDNVPLSELSSAEGCLAEYMNGKTAEIAAAKGDPRKIFGRHPLSPLPDADAVDLCVAQIHSANTCENFLTVSRVFQIDNEVAEQEALVTAEVENGGAVAVRGLQSGGLELHRHMLGSEDRQAETGAGKPGQPVGVAPRKDREGVRVPEDRRRLALQNHLAAAGRFRRHAERALGLGSVPN